MTIEQFNDLKDNDRIESTNPVTHYQAKGTVVHIGEFERAIVWDDTHRVQRIRRHEVRSYSHLFEHYKVLT